MLNPAQTGLPYTISTGITISDDNVHTADTDGYIQAYAGGNSGDSASAWIGGSTYYFTSRNGTQMVFIRKGMTYQRRSVGCTGSYNLMFIPIV